MIIFPVNRFVVFSCTAAMKSHHLHHQAKTRWDQLAKILKQESKHMHTSLSFGWCNWLKHFAELSDQLRWWYGRSSNFPRSEIGFHNCLSSFLLQDLTSRYLLRTVDKQRFVLWTRIWSPDPEFLRTLNRKFRLLPLHFRIQILCPLLQDDGELTVLQFRFYCRKNRQC